MLEPAGGVLFGVAALLLVGVMRGPGTPCRVPEALTHAAPQRRIERGNVHIYFPIVTCILVNAVLSFILWLFNR